MFLSSCSWTSIILDCNGTWWGFGRNNEGQLALEADNDVAYPRVASFPHNLASVRAGSRFVTWLTPTGELWISGKVKNYRTNGFERIETDKAIDKVAAGLMYFLALDVDGKLWGGGENDSGQLGPRLEEFEVGVEWRRIPCSSINKQIINIACGGCHCFVVDIDNGVWSMGKNNRGQLGLGPKVNRLDLQTSFKKVNLDFCVAEVYGGFEHSVIVQDDGSIWTCGSSTFGQIGEVRNDSQTSEFLKIPNLHTRKRAFGGHHSLVMNEVGEVYVWGYNAFGQLGLENKTNQSSPTRLSAFSQVQLLAAGRNHSMVVDESGWLWVFGNNYNGELGIGVVRSGDQSKPHKSEAFNQHVIM